MSSQPGPEARVLPFPRLDSPSGARRFEPSLSGGSPRAPLMQTPVLREVVVRKGSTRHIRLRTTTTMATSCHVKEDKIQLISLCTCCRINVVRMCRSYNTSKGCHPFLLA